MTSAAAFVLLTRMHEHYMFYSLVNTVVALTIAWFGVRWVEGDREMSGHREAERSSAFRVFGALS